MDNTEWGQRHHLQTVVAIRELAGRQKAGAQQLGWRWGAPTLEACAALGPLLAPQAH